MTPAERVAARLAEVSISREKAQKAQKWTAVSQLSQAEDRLLQQLLELEAEEAQREADAEEALDARQLLGEIRSLAMALPSYLLDELIDELEEARRLTPVTEWVPK